MLVQIATPLLSTLFVTTMHTTILASNTTWPTGIFLEGNVGKPRSDHSLSQELGAAKPDNLRTSTKSKKTNTMSSFYILNHTETRAIVTKLIHMIL